MQRIEFLLLSHGKIQKSKKGGAEMNYLIIAFLIIIAGLIVIIARMKIIIKNLRAEVRFLRKCQYVAMTTDID